MTGPIVIGETKVTAKICEGKINEFFRLRGYEKINKNVHFYCIFQLSFRKSASIFGEMKINIVITYKRLQLFISYVFLKKSNFPFFLFFNIKFHIRQEIRCTYPIYWLRKYSLLALINSRKNFKSCNQLNLELGQIGAISDFYSFKLNTEWAYSDEWYLSSFRKLILFVRSMCSISSSYSVGWGLSSRLWHFFVI